MQLSAEETLFCKFANYIKVVKSAGFRAVWVQTRFVCICVMCLCGRYVCWSGAVLYMCVTVQARSNAYVHTPKRLCLHQYAELVRMHCFHSKQILANIEPQWKWTSFCLIDHAANDVFLARGALWDSHKVKTFLGHQPIHQDHRNHLPPDWHLGSQEGITQHLT